MLTIEMKLEFSSLASQLSPENLSCDGELSRAETIRKSNKLMTRWRELESKVGRKINDTEVYGWHKEIWEHQKMLHAAELAKYPVHPTLVLANPGVWIKQSSSGKTQYYIHKRNGTILNLSGKNITIKADKKFKLYCNLAFILGDAEQLGEFSTLDQCVVAGDNYIKSITFEVFKSKRPQYRDENIQRELHNLL